MPRRSTSELAASPTDSRRARSEATKDALMRAAEQLFAQEGVENVSIRDIVSAADQKNESALQYHFKNLSGLIDAIHKQRAQQVQDKRVELLSAALEKSAQPKLRQLCALMVTPSFQLAQDSDEFRYYIKAFGHQLALSDSSPLKTVHGKKSREQLGALLAQELTHLDKADYRARMEAAVRLCAASMHHQARQTKGFRGKAADLFLNNLIDALFGLLNAPVSAETRRLKPKH